MSVRDILLRLKTFLYLSCVGGSFLDVILSTKWLHLQFGDPLWSYAPFLPVGLSWFQYFSTSSSPLTIPCADVYHTVFIPFQLFACVVNCSRSGARLAFS